MVAWVYRLALLGAVGPAVRLCRHDCWFRQDAFRQDMLSMRIGEPARNIRVPDADIWHGVRNATHKIDMVKT